MAHAATYSLLLMSIFTEIPPLAGPHLGFVAHLYALAHFQGGDWWHTKAANRVVIRDRRPWYQSDEWLSITET